MFRPWMIVPIFQNLWRVSIFDISMLYKYILIVHCMSQNMNSRKNEQCINLTINVSKLIIYPIVEALNLLIGTYWVVWHLPRCQTLLSNSYWSTTSSTILWVVFQTILLLYVSFESSFFASVRITAYWTICIRTFSHPPNLKLILRCEC